MAEKAASVDNKKATYLSRWFFSNKDTKKPESSFLELSDFFYIIMFWGTHTEPVGTLCEPPYLSPQLLRIRYFFQIRWRVFCIDTKFHSCTIQFFIDFLKKCCYLIKQTIPGFFRCLFPYPGILVCICFKL